MSAGVQTTSGSWWKNSLLDRVAELRQREDQVFLVLALVIGALTGAAVVVPVTEFGPILGEIDFFNTHA